MQYGLIKCAVCRKWDSHCRGDKVLGMVCIECAPYCELAAVWLLRYGFDYGIRPPTKHDFRNA